LSDASSWASCSSRWASCFGLVRSRDHVSISPHRQLAPHSAALPGLSHHARHRHVHR
jgi:hypothetical protein